MAPAQREDVREIDSPRRPARRMGNKTDDLDAVRVARDALGRDGLAPPRKTGNRDALAALLVVRRSAVSMTGDTERQLIPLAITCTMLASVVPAGKDGGKSEQGLAAKTVRNTHVVLRKALADAERLGLVPRNAASAAHAPTARRPEFATWSSDDLEEFFAAVHDDRLFAAFVVLTTTGMRRGE